MIPATPIITISLGEERTFRLRSWPAKPGAKFIDSPAKNGTVFVMPWETNRVFTHEVPAQRSIEAGKSPSHYALLRMTKLEKIREVITKAVSCGQNVLLEGPHGTGKSSLALGVAGKLGLRLKYFSAPTLDPFADLVGIPVPILDDG